MAEDQTRSTIHCYVTNAEGTTRQWILPPEVIAPPSYLIFGRTIYAQQGTWTVPAKAGEIITCEYAPAPKGRVVDITDIKPEPGSIRATSTPATKQVAA